mgnify:CR=1 FL=1
MQSLGRGNRAMKQASSPLHKHRALLKCLPCCSTAYHLSFPLQLGGGIENDPLIRGFDGSVFHFDHVGEFALIENGDGFKVGRVVVRQVLHYCCRS